MPNQGQEKQLLLVSMGVPAFAILAIVALLMHLSSIIFYLCAVIAIGLGLYLAFNLSKDSTSGSEATQSRKRK